ncbi:hypothetical protein LTR53_015966 [Teratosphaeriaceae sp. CCFEE 6253]|nr:hypothetical protein LTR53_015966 [Teratosphaeriaceae sp. CCFEE 6253]
MALHRGIQSAIFYYLSCAPCSDARYRKRRKQEAHRDRLAKAELEAQMPDLYRHPSPSSTNPHWQAEIALGPVLLSRGAKRKVAATSTSGSRRGDGVLRPSTVQSSSDGSLVASSTNVGRLSTPDDRHDSKYSFGPHQRRDDELWGSTATDLPLRSFMDGSVIGNGPTIPPRAHTKASSSRYQAPGNPSINDLHPATVTKVNSKEEVAWMLQPPPIAEVMSGKACAYSSRSNSTRSRLSANSSPLSRQASERGVIERPVPSASSTMARSRGRALSLEGQGHDRSRGHRPAPLHLKEASEESEITVLHRPFLAPEPTRIRHPGKAASRPQLSTIFSDNIAPADPDFGAPIPRPKAENSLPSAQNSETSSGERDKTARRPAVLVNDTALRLLQDGDAKKASLFNTRIFATTPGAVDPRLLRLTTPAVDGGEEEEEEGRLTSGGQPDLFVDWDTPEFELGEWVHELTKRPGVKHRWSMDI